MNYLRRHAGAASIVVAAVALVVGPIAALAVNDESEDRHDDAVNVATSEAVALDTRLDDAAQERGELRGRVDALEGRLDALSARLNDLEALTVVEQQAASAEAVELAEDAHDPTGVEAQAVTSDDPYDALAACESSGDTDGEAPHLIDHAPPGPFITEFQFSADTARKVGAYAGMPYADAKAAAQAWAARDDVDASSRAGWPTCWPLVMGDTPT